MKAAFAIWKERIAPVFDVARQVHLVEASMGRVVEASRQPLGDGMPLQKAIDLAGMGIGILVCGAISRPLHAMVAARGIEVIAFVAGDLEEIVQAWLGGRLGEACYAMPGCRGGRQRLAGWVASTPKGGSMPAAMGSGGAQGGAGRGAGAGNRGARPGRMGGRAFAGPEGSCICPRCGHEAKHLRGMPCMQQTCPRCGSAMTRKPAPAAAP